VLDGELRDYGGGTASFEIPRSVTMSPMSPERTATVCAFAALLLATPLVHAPSTNSYQRPSRGTPGALPAAGFAYNDSYRGWPVAPLDAQHPVRGSFLDPRSPGRGGNYHFGIDISVRDSRPEAGAPAGRTHRVYAIESGRARVPANQRAVGCVRRRVMVGHFEYWHTDTVGVVRNGDRIRPGQLIGWTCKGLWHLHLAERRQIDGITTWVNPLRRGGKLAPYVDTSSPVIHAIRFYTAAFAGWSISASPLRAQSAGSRMSQHRLRGIVDARAWIADPQSFRGFFTVVPAMYADLHPYRVRVELTRLRPQRRVLARDVFRADVFFSASLPSRGLPILFDYHYAPGTTQTLPAGNCLARRHGNARAGCQGRYWFRLFARSTTAFWDTTRYENGKYQLDVIAWDVSGNRARATTSVTIDNR
jgi:hypothetical protein